ncbi:alpha/beta hydrolase [Pseudonocardia zijingensis]|jgi:pimeloyl-ACP methyl ester carboxylesterase|uniref:Alpha/beta hydrolase n=1 Tax=Pseudonocardia zijingensis TaxID=153376 RepID=A0ABN1PKY3_9PSEU
MQTVTSADGTTIAFDQIGAGPPLVLVAGAACDRAADAGIAAGLAARFTVLNHDRRGRGDSGEASPYAVEREIEDLEVLLAAAGGSAVVVGLSSGAVLAAYAAAAGLPIGHLVMWEPPFRLDAAGQQGAREYGERLRALLADGRRGDAVELFMTVAGVPAEAIAGMRQSPYWARGEALAPTLAHDAQVMGDGSVPVERLAAITAPTAVFAGGASPDWFREAARAAAAAIPGAVVRELLGETHAVTPDVLAAAVHEFAGSSASYARRP